MYAKVLGTQYTFKYQDNHNPTAYLQKLHHRGIDNDQWPVDQMNHSVPHGDICLHNLAQHHSLCVHAVAAQSLRFHVS